MVAFLGSSIHIGLKGFGIGSDGSYGSFDVMGKGCYYNLVVFHGLLLVISRLLYLSPHAVKGPGELTEVVGPLIVKRYVEISFGNIFSEILKFTERS